MRLPEILGKKTDTADTSAKANLPPAGRQHKYNKIPRAGLTDPHGYFRNAQTLPLPVDV